MSIINYKYDAAFTLVEEDKEICRTVNDLIKNKLSTFAYFENKEEIAAHNGLDKFYNIFFHDSRIVVVILNKYWGKTDYTSKEELAIRNRIVKDGWDFIIIVKLKKEMIMPAWYPIADIYVNYEDYGAEGVASVIEKKARELGIHVKQESIIEKAKRVNDERSNLLKIKETLEKENVGIKLAEVEVRNLFTLIKEKIDQLSKVASGLFIKISKDEFNYIQISTTGRVYNINWYPISVNYLDGAYLNFNIKLKDTRRGYTTDYHDLLSYVYNFSINPSWIYGWKISDKFYTSNKLVDEWIDIILKEMENQNKNIK